MGSARVPVCIVRPRRTNPAPFGGTTCRKLGNFGSQPTIYEPLYKTFVSSDLHFQRLENDFFKTKRALKSREVRVAGDFAFNQGKKEC